MNKLMGKRIAIFNGSLEQGGAERVISILSSKMIDMGYKVEILLYYDRPVFYELNKKVKVCTVEGSTNSRNKLVNFFWIRRYFKENVDVVLSFLAPFNILSLLSSVGAKYSIIVADRNDPHFVPRNYFLRKLRDVLYSLVADGVVVQTTQNRDYFSKAVQRKSRIIFNPIDLNGKEGCALSANKQKIIVSVGRLMPQKNQELLIKAFSKIHSMYPEYSLIIYGDDGNASHKKKLDKIIEELDLQKCVNLPGNISNIIDAIATAELFVLSSDYEGMPNALIEAMCVGLPCVSTKVSGASDLIEHKFNGELVETGNQEQLESAIISIIENSELRNKYAMNAIGVYEKLQIDTIINEWIDFLESV